ncbi:MAG TPA: hypothetical protein VH478_11605, partial [Trebonia sp.]|nr:hypothetical protein [Trebonia sp.]
ARSAGPQAGAGLWSDGVHLSELGDTMLLHAVEQHLRETRLIDDLTRYELCERSAALARYGHLFTEDRK